jgi:hypothetical protein
VSGEASKKSGEIGEKLAQEFLKLIGWNPSIKTISIPCVRESEHNRQSHGDDGLYLYNSPFTDGTTEIVHVSVKHKANGYPNGTQGLRNELKKHLIELNTIIACARLSKNVNSIIDTHQSKAKRNHRGLLIWVHSDESTLDRDIRTEISDMQLSDEYKTPIFLVDSGRLSFIFNAISHCQNAKLDSFDFYYPRLGSAVLADHNRFGKSLPIELIVSDVLPIRGMKNNQPKLYLYVREKFSVSALKKIYALAYGFADAWVEDVYIGFEDYNESKDSQLRDEALLAFENRTKNVSVFSYKASLLNLLEDTE